MVEDVKDQINLDSLVAACADTSFEDGLRIDTELEPLPGPRGPVEPAVYERRAQRPGRVFISRLNPTTMAHELGHNLSLSHAPWGGAGGPDPAFPTPDGSIGAWGYDFRNGGALASPARTDLMSYCESWISNYHFTNALRFRLFDEGPPRAVSPAAQETESLLLWGGIGPRGEPFLNPSFVVDAPPALPRAAGEHQITGRSITGNELFSLSFGLPEVADGDGS